MSKTDNPPDYFYKGRPLDPLPAATASSLRSRFKSIDVDQSNTGKTRGLESLTDGVLAFVKSSNIEGEIPADILWHLVGSVVSQLSVMTGTVRQEISKGEHIKPSVSYSRYVERLKTEQQKRQAMNALERDLDEQMKHHQQQEANRDLAQVIQFRRAV